MRGGNLLTHEARGSGAWGPLSRSGCPLARHGGRQEALGGKGLTPGPGHGTSTETRDRLALPLPVPEPQEIQLSAASPAFLTFV